MSPSKKASSSLLYPFVFIILVVGLLYFGSDLAQFMAQLVVEEEPTVEETKPVVEQIPDAPKDEVDVLIDAYHKELQGECEKPVYFIGGEGAAGLEKFSTVKEAYHSYINCLFNGAVERMEKKVVQGPASQRSQKQELTLDCLEPGLYKRIMDTTEIMQVHEASGKNYGLAELVIEEYKDYMAYLNIKEEFIADELEDFQTTFSVHEQYQVRRAAEFERERKTAKDAFDMAFQAYDEMRMAYPLHIQLQCTAKHIEKERKQLARVRTYAQCLPAKFINAATSAYDR